MIVVDTNVLAYFLVPGPHSQAAQAVFAADSLWAAPLLWRSEFRNIIVLQMRHRGLSHVDAEGLMHNAMEIIADREFDIDSSKLFAVAAQFALSAYDAEYVSLADALRLPLVTTDEQILRTASSVAVHPCDFV
jgi:predicted nucleic acid-binding protein